MPRFKVQWSGNIFATSIINAIDKEDAMTKVEKGQVELDTMDGIEDIEVEECDEII